MHVGVDLDEVLSESVRFLLSCLQKSHRITWEYEDVTHHELDEMEGFPLWREELIQLFRREFLNPSNMDRVSPIEGSLKNLSLLARSHRLTCITARNPLLREITFQWIEGHFPGMFSHVEMLGTHSTGVTKGEACEALKVDVMIDDSMGYAQSVVSKGIPCILLEKPWNRNRKETHPLLHRVSEWDEIPPLLERILP